MDNKNVIQSSIKSAAKWAVVTELCSKLISPVTNMLLARILTPEMFGIVASVTMVFTLADMLSDAGFQKYLVHKDFQDDQDLHQQANVAFWSNLAISLLLWFVIALFSDQIASLMGLSGYGPVFVAACASLPLTSVSSVQTAIFRRRFHFKALFHMRLIGAFIPLVITVPLALYTRSYWALIIGSICGHLSNALVLTIKSDWKPAFFFKCSKLREMLSFSSWSLTEAVTVWLSEYIGVFIVGAILSSHYLGLYRTAMGTVNQFVTLISTAMAPVLFSGLSRLRENRAEFESTFFNFQRLTSYLLVPMGIGIYLYRDVITGILLGSQWGEASGFVGLWGLVSAVKIIYSNYCYEVYRAIGRPKLAVIAQLCLLAVQIPSIYLAAHIGFEQVYITRSLVVLVLIAANQTIMNRACGFKTSSVLRNTYPAFAASFVMAAAACVLRSISGNIAWSFVSIGICVVVYFAALIVIYPESKKELKNIGMVIKKDGK